MANDKKAPAADDACQAQGGTEEQQNPNRTAGAALAAKAALAADKAAAAKAEAEGKDASE